jgi:hypothetical protein
MSDDYQRIELITGTARRRYWSTEQKLRIIEQSFEPGEPVSSVARRPSQRHEGWTAAPTLYDDGGFSGGTMQRPALQRLMTDIEAGEIDAVVVYKVDRLTRALSDFARLAVSGDLCWTTPLAIRVGRMQTVQR